MEQVFIYLDFDGTVVEHKYPRIGAENPNAINVLKQLKAKGYKIILNTYRADISDQHTNEAIQYLGQRGVEVDSVAGVKLAPKQWTPTKIFIDDLPAAGCPLRPTIELHNSQMVDWITLEKYFKQEGIL